MTWDFYTRITHCVTSALHTNVLTICTTTVCKKPYICTSNYCSFHWIGRWLKTKYYANTKYQPKFLVAVSIQKEDWLSSSLFKLKQQQKLSLTIGVWYLVYSHQRSNEKNISIKDEKSVVFINNGSTVDNFYFCEETYFCTAKKNLLAVVLIFIIISLVEAIYFSNSNVLLDIIPMSHVFPSFMYIDRYIVFQKQVSAHTVILEYFNTKEKALSNFASSLSRYSSAPKTKRIFQMLWCIFEIIQFIHFYPLF